MQLARFIPVLLVVACVHGQNLPSIVEALEADGRFKILVKALTITGTTTKSSSFLFAQNSGFKGITLFAPNDEAFNSVFITERALNNGTLFRWDEEIVKEELVRILGYHIVVSQVKSSELTNGMDLVAWHRNARLRISIDQQSKTIKINSATVTTADIMCSDGIIHIIDQVLLEEAAGTWPYDGLGYRGEVERRDNPGPSGESCVDLCFNEEKCLQAAPRCIYVKVTQEDMQTVLRLLDTDKSGTVSRAEYQHIAKGDSPLLQVKFREYDQNGDGELSYGQGWLDEGMQMIQAAGYRSCCRTSPDPCSARFGNDAAACTLQWSPFPGCCHVAGQCLSYKHNLHNPLASCARPGIYTIEDQYSHVTGSSCERMGKIKITTEKECIVAANYLGLKTHMMFGFPRTNVPGGCIYEVDQKNVDFNSNIEETATNIDRRLICKVYPSGIQSNGQIKGSLVLTAKRHRRPFSVLYTVEDETSQKTGSSCENLGKMKITTAEECVVAANYLELKVDTTFGFPRTNAPGGCIYEVDQKNVDFNSNIEETSTNIDRHLICKSGSPLLRSGDNVYIQSMTLNNHYVEVSGHAGSSAGKVRYRIGTRAAKEAKAEFIFFKIYKWSGESGPISSGDSVYIQAMTLNKHYVEVSDAGGVRMSETKEAGAEFKISRWSGESGPISSGDNVYIQATNKQTMINYDHYVEVSGDAKGGYRLSTRATKEAHAEFKIDRISILYTVEDKTSDKTGSSCSSLGKMQITTAEECIVATNYLGFPVHMMFGFPRTNVPGGCIYEVDQKNVDFNSNIEEPATNIDRRLVCKVFPSGIMDSGTDCHEFASWPARPISAPQLDTHWPAANYAIQASIAELANVAVARVDVKLVCDSRMVRAEYTIAIPPEYNGYLHPSSWITEYGGSMAQKHKLARAATILSSTNNDSATEVCTKHITARGLSWDIEVHTMTASVKYHGKTKKKALAGIDSSSILTCSWALLGLLAFHFVC